MFRYSRFLPMFWHAVRGFFKQGRIDFFPARHSFGRYNLLRAKNDTRAAIDVALVGIPQGMAFAAMAGLPIIYGVMAATVGTFVAPWFIKCRLTVSGPSNATAFMLASFFLANPSFTMEDRMMLVPIIVFFAGVFCVIGSFVKVTELLQYVSRSVLVGYVTGAAVLIVASQLKYIFGIQYVMDRYFAVNETGRTFFSICQGFVMSISQTLWQPLVLGALTLGGFFFMRKRWKALPSFAILLVGMSGLNYLLSMGWMGGLFDCVDRLQGFTMSDLTLAAPKIFQPQIFNLFYDILPIIFGIAFLSSLEQTVMSKTISAKTGERLNLNQDTFAVGMSNIASSFTTSLPSSASLTRSILNYNSGASSRFSGVICGLICMGIVYCLAYFPITKYIPQSVLAALVLANAISLFDKRSLRICFRSTPGDAVVLISTCLSALIMPLHTAIFIGVAISVSIFLRKASKPELIEYMMDGDGQLQELQSKANRIPQISIVHVEGDLFFGAAELFRNQVQRMTEDDSLQVVILRLKNARNLDATSVWALEDLIRFTREHHRHIVISGASKAVYRVLRKSGVLKTLQEGCVQGERNIFLYSPSNPNFSTRQALKRAQQLLGSDKADISIFYNPNVERAK